MDNTPAITGPTEDHGDAGDDGGSDRGCASYGLTSYSVHEIGIASMIAGILILIVSIFATRI